MRERFRVMWVSPSVKEKVNFRVRVSVSVKVSVSAIMM